MHTCVGVPQTGPIRHGLNQEGQDSPYEVTAAASSKLDPGDAPSPSMAESNKLGAKLRLIPLEIHAFNQEAGAMEGRAEGRAVAYIFSLIVLWPLEKLAPANEKCLSNKKVGKKKTLDKSVCWTKQSQQLQMEM